MKIIFVFDNYIIGGIEKVGLNYINHLIENGTNVDAIVLGKYDEDAIINLEKSVNVLYKKKYTKYLSPYFYYKIIEKYKFGFLIYPIIFLFMFCILPIKRLIYSIFNNYDVAIAFSGHFNDLDYVSSKYVKAKSKVAWLHGSLMDYYVDSYGYMFLYKKIHNLIAISSYNDNLCTKIINRFNINLFHLYNPLLINKKLKDIDYINDLKKKYGEYFLYVGRLDDDKQPDVIIRALKILFEKYKIKRNLLIVGDGKNRKQLEQLTEKLNLKEQIYFIGKREDVINYYMSAFAFIHSSKAEGLPTTILEAMKCSLPIISTKSMPGVYEILDNDKYGLTCEVGNFDEMANCMFKITTNKELYNYYGKQCKIRIKTFDPKIIFKSFDSYLNNLINN